MTVFKYKSNLVKEKYAVEEISNSLYSLLQFSYYKLGRILDKHGIKSFYKPPIKIQHMLKSVKDNLLLRHVGIYSTTNVCRMIYTGQTGRTITERC